MSNQGFGPGSSILAQPIERTALFDTPAVVGARWWQKSVEEAIAIPTRRSALVGIAALVAGVGVLAIGANAAFKGDDDDDDGNDDEIAVGTAALDAQKQYGWSFGSEGESLPAQPGGLPDRALMQRLSTELAPTNGRYRPFYVPTLLEAISATPTATNPKGPIKPLIDQLAAVRTDDTDRAYARGRALASLFDQAPPGRAVIVDLPGPEAVAFAAGLADALDPVLLFDNWPHPRGVVPAHMTLGALATYAQPMLDAAKARKPGAPPAFVLDANRLAAYSDQSDRFDNRWIAKVPSAGSLSELGVQQVLYVRPAEVDLELDDLSDDFVAWAASGIEVKIVPAIRFAKDDEDAVVATTSAQAQSPVDAGAPEVGTQPTTITPSHYYYGDHHTHWCFWSHYGWGPSVHVYRPPVFVAPSWRPTTRPTIFSGLGSSKSPPPSFAHVNVVKSKSTGGTIGGSWGRTGSYGS